MALNSPEKTPERFRIGDLELDTGAVSVRRGREEIALPKLSFDLLLCLARHAPNVVSTDVLMDEVWGKTVVGEETVKQRVTLLRKALGDSSDDPRYVLAVRGRGYRMLADVATLDDGSRVPAEPGAPRNVLKTLLVVAVVIAAVAVGYAVLDRNDTPETRIPAANPETGERGGTENPQAWEAYVKGRAAYRRWTRQDNETAFAHYQQALELDPEFALAAAGVANTHALRATAFGMGDEWIDKAIERARYALELEPELPEALKALGICHVYRGRYQAALDYYRNALRIAPEYDEVIFNMAEIMHMLGRWDEAIAYQQLDTHRAAGLERLSIYLRDLGFGERAERLARAVEKDLPFSFPSDSNRSLHDLLNGDYDSARKLAQRMQRALPHAAEGWLREGEVDLITGEYESAAKHFGTARQAAGGFQDYANLRLAQIQLAEGNVASADPLLQEVKTDALQAIADGHEGWFHRWNLALAHSLLGDRDEAVDWFEQAVDSGRRRYEWDEMEPAFEPIRDEHRFQVAIQRQKDLRLEMKRNAEATLPQ